MKKSQIVCKGIYYYALVIFGILTCLYLLGFVYTAFNGFTFFTTDYGWEGMAEYGVLFGIVYGVFSAPFLLYILIFFIYMKKHLECKEKRFADYVRSKKFYIPIVAAAGMVVIAFLVTQIDYAVSKRLPIDTTDSVAECLKQGVFIDVPYTGDEQYAGKIVILGRGEAVDWMSEFIVDEEPIRKTVDYMFRPDFYLENFCIIVLPLHEGRMEEISLKKSSINYGSCKKKAVFSCRTDGSPQQYLSFYIVAEQNMLASYFYDQDREEEPPWESEVTMENR